MTTRRSEPASTVQTAAGAFAVDAICVLIFCATGRRSHGEGWSVTGIAQTAWPFLIGLVVGWLLSRGWRRPFVIRPTGLIVWLSTVAIGMALRAATGAGVAVSFVVVATLVNGAFLLGWRRSAAKRAAK